MIHNSSIPIGLSPRLKRYIMIGVETLKSRAKKEKSKEKWFPKASTMNRRDDTKTK